MQFLRRLIARLRSWKLGRRAASLPISLVYFEFDVRPPIHRDVSAQGVRIFSLCEACGARLNASATLCNDCAQKKSRPARPY
jgi:ribosomal protein L40E